MELRKIKEQILQESVLVCDRIMQQAEDAANIEICKELGVRNFKHKKNGSIHTIQINKSIISFTVDEYGNASFVFPFDLMTLAEFKLMYRVLAEYVEFEHCEFPTRPADHFVLAVYDSMDDCVSFNEVSMKQYLETIKIMGSDISIIDYYR